MVVEDRIKTKIFLLAKRKIKTFFISNTSFAKRKIITLANISRKRNQKTNVSFYNFNTDDSSYKKSF